MRSIAQLVDDNRATPENGHKGTAVSIRYESLIDEIRDMYEKVRERLPERKDRKRAEDLEHQLEVMKLQVRDLRRGLWNALDRLDWAAEGLGGEHKYRLQNDIREYRKLLCQKCGGFEKLLEASKDDKMGKTVPCPDCAR